MGEAVGEDHAARPHNCQGETTLPASVNAKSALRTAFYNLSDPAMEDMLYEVESVRRFCGIQLEKVQQDETTILSFRHLLEYDKLVKNLFEIIKEHPARSWFAAQERNDPGCEPHGDDLIDKEP